MKKIKKYEYVKSLRLAGWLMLNGFRILRINHNLEVKGKDIYINKRTKEKNNYGINNKNR